jgi:hypothetical protein
MSFTITFKIHKMSLTSHFLFNCCNTFRPYKTIIRKLLLCVVCPVSHLSVVLFCVMCVICVLCLIVLLLPPDKTPFSVKINNKKIIKIIALHELTRQYIYMLLLHVIIRECTSALHSHYFLVATSTLCPIVFSLP